MKFKYKTMAAEPKAIIEDEKLATNQGGDDMTKESQIDSSKPSAARGLTPTEARIEDSEEQADPKGFNQKYNNYAQIYEHLGIDVSQNRALTSEIASGFTNTVRSVMEGKLGAVDLAEIKKLESDKKMNKFYVAKMKAFLASHLKGAFGSKAFKSYYKLIKSTKTITGLITIWLACNLDEPEKEAVNIAFSHCVSTLLYGQGFMEPDRVSKYLENAKVRDKDGVSVNALPILDKLLGVGTGRLPNQNSSQEQAIAGQILTQTLLSADADASINMGEILNNIAATRPESPFMDSLVQESLDFILGFRKGVETKLGDTETSEVNKEIAQEAKNRSAAEISALQETKKDLVDQLERANSAREEKFAEMDRLSDELKDSALTVGEREAKKQRLETLRKKEGDYKVSSKLEQRIEELDKKVDSLRESSRKLDEGDLESKKSAIVANNKLYGHVTRLAAYIAERTAQLEKSGVTVDFAEMPTIKNLLEIAKNPDNLKKSELSAQMSEFFTDSAVLAIDRELRGLRDVLTEKRVYTPQELSLAVLSEVYKKKYGYTQDTANFMASANYIRIAKEKNLRDFRRQVLEDRATNKLKGVDKYPFAEMLKRIVRDESKGSISPSEMSVLESLNGSMSLDDIRKTLADGSLSIDAINFVMYNLLSTIAPKKCSDGSMVTLKAPKDIAEAEKLADNLNRIASEYAALETMNNAQAISAKDKSKFGVFALAEGLKAYQTKFDANERRILISAKHHASYMTTRAKSKAILAEIIATAKAEGWDKERFEQEKLNRGIADLPENGNVKFRVNQATNYSREKAIMVKNGIKNAATKTWQAKGKIAKVATSPLWGPPYLLWKAAKGTANFTAKKLSQLTDFVTYQVPNFAAHAVLAPVSVAITNPLRGLRDGVSNAINTVGPARYDALRDRTLTRVNGVLLPKAENNNTKED